jgi:integrase/recombinase XerD
MNTITYTVQRSAAERILTQRLTALDGSCKETRNLRRHTLWRFVTELSEPDDQGAMHLVLSDKRLFCWLIRYVAGRRPANARRRLSILGHYLRALEETGLIGADLVGLFKIRHRRRSWKVITGVLQAENAETELAAICTDLSSVGPLAIPMRVFFELHRSLGKDYRVHELVLNGFDRFLRSAGVCSPQAICRAHVERWLDTLTCSPATRVWHVRLTEHFFQYLHQIKVVTDNPVTSVRLAMARSPRRSFRPFIFTQAQITAILAKAKELPSNARFPLRGPTCYTMLILLYVLGLRHGEARHLRVRDLDWGRQTLLISETKFHKSRYIPFGPKVANCLQQFLDVRRKILPPLQDDDPLFVTLWRKPFMNGVLLGAFRVLLRNLNITGIEGQPSPRLHDLRHTFAVHRLLRWYREGVDVQSRLSILSTFLGHVEPAYTQVYLTITAELLHEANKRFHQHFGCLFDQEVRP